MGSQSVGSFQDRFFESVSESVSEAVFGAVSEAIFRAFYLFLLNSASFDLILIVSEGSVSAILRQSENPLISTHYKFYLDFCYNSFLNLLKVKTCVCVLRVVLKQSSESLSGHN